MVMAKPIRETPELRGRDARLFIERMIRVEKGPISDIDKAILERVKAKTPYFDSFLK